VETACPPNYLCRTLNRLSVIKSTIDSIVKVPLQIPSETSVRSKKDELKKNSVNKAPLKMEAVENASGSDVEATERKISFHPKGYIKYPRYDFF
jgi:hypothetical protein